MGANSFLLQQPFFSRMLVHRKLQKLSPFLGINGGNFRISAPNVVSIGQNYKRNALDKIFLTCTKMEGKNHTGVYKLRFEIG